MKKKIRLLTFVICIWMIIGFNIEAMAANNALAIQVNDDFGELIKIITQTSHIKNGICSLKNQYFSSQNSAQAAAEPHSNAFCMYFGSR